MSISQAAENLIVAEEVSSKAAYEKKYRKPVKPGADSGITVGIGYDCGHQKAEQIRNDWSGRLPSNMVDALVSAAGKTQSSAAAILPAMKRIVDVPWEVAIKEFREIEVPRWEDRCRKYLPNFDKLNPDCRGAILSLAYNRGTSFTKAGDRYREMRNIRSHMANQFFDRIPAEFRSMKRLWTTPDVAGVAKRRDAEAKLFEKGLKAMAVSLASDEPYYEPIKAMSGDNRYDEPDVTPIAPEIDTDGQTVPLEPIKTADGRKLNVQPQRAVYDPEVELYQRKLVELGYHEVGGVDGKFGGMTVAAIAAFKNDRGINGGNSIDSSFKNEIQKCFGIDGKPIWTRPIAVERAQVTANEIAKQEPSVNQTLWQRLVAKVTGIGAGIGALWSGVTGYFSELREKTEWIQNFFADIPGWFWFMILAGGALAWYLSANKITNELVDAKRTGKLS